MTEIAVSAKACSSAPVPDGLRHDWGRAEVEALFAKPFADLIFEAQSAHRRFFDPNEVQMSTLLSIKTGGCPEDCGYCPQSSKFDTNVKASKLMAVGAVLEEAKRARDAGASRYCMGAAWRSPKDKDLDQVIDMVRGVKSLGMETCVTLGMLDQGQAQRLKDAGLDYYNHNLDTSPEYYSEIITTRTYQDRLDTLSNVRDAGINVCCGGIGEIPRRSNRRWSRSASGLAVVSSFGPMKIELAPARKHSACNSSFICSRPAERRIIEAGIRILATAMVRTKSKPSSGAWPDRGVPSTWTSRLIGTDSGCTGRLARVTSRPARSFKSSPMPTMPPQQTFMPASRTASSVSSRSWNSRVVMISP